MATELGQAFVQIVPSARGIGPATEKVLNNEMGGAGESAGKKLTSKLKGVIVKAGVGAALWKTLNTGAELQQNLGGSEAVFGNYYKTIQNQAKSAYMNMGLSQSDYLATANKMGSLFQGSGLTQKRSLDLTTQAMQRAADVASVMGIDTSMAMESIAGAAKGQFQMMDNLGVAMNATTLEAYALEKGINFKWNTASNAEKAEMAMKMFMDRTSQYEGNFAKESEQTFSGSIGAMKAAAQDLMGNLMIGENVTESMQNLARTMTTFIGGNLIPVVGRIFGGLPTVVMTAIEAIHPALMIGLAKAIVAVKNNAPKMIENALNGLLDFSATLRKNAGQLVTSGLALIKTLADSIIKNIPVFIQTVPTIISNFAGIINDNAPKVFAAALSIMKNLAVGLIKAIPVIIQNLPKILKAIWDVFTAFQWMNLGKQVIQGIGKGFKAAATNIKTAASNLVKSVKTTFSNGFNAVKTSVIGIFNRIKNGITSPITAAKTKLSGIISKIKGLFPFKLGKILSLKLPRISVKGGKAPFGIGGKGSLPSFSVKWFAKGGIVDGPTLFGAGEAGPEAIMPLDKIQDYTGIDYDRLASAMVRALSAVNHTTTVEVDGREVARTTAPYMETELNRIQKRSNRKLGYI